MSKNNAGPEALAPNHFLLGYKSTNREAVKSMGKRILTNDKFKFEMARRARYGRLWYSLVYMADEENRQNWIRGVVDETMKGADNIIR